MRMTWSQALTAYDDVTFLWQDLDGLHLAPLPSESPHTSILWGSDAQRMVRLRIDGDAVYAAEATVGDQGLDRTVTAPWQANWGPVQQFRSADGVELTQAFEMYVRRSGSGSPITFLRAGS